MATKNLAQNESIEIDLPDDGISTVAITTPAATSATAVFALEGILDDVSEYVGPITVVNQLVAPKTEAANVTGPSKAACANVGGFKKVRVRRTDATGGNGTVSFNSQKA